MLIFYLHVIYLLVHVIVLLLVCSFVWFRDVKMVNGLEKVEAQDGTEYPDESINPHRIDQIISDYRRVQESANNEIDRKRRAVRSKCDERLWMAALWRDYQLEIVKKTFDSEIKQIEREHQVR